MSVISQVWRLLTCETAPGGKTHRCRDETSQVELGSPVLGDQVGVGGMFGDPAPHVRTVGQDGQVAFPGRVEAGLDEPAGQAVAAEPGVGLGVQERDHTVAQVVLDGSGELAVGPDLVLRLFWMVGDRHVHAPRITGIKLRLPWRRPGPRGPAAARPGPTPGPG